MTTGTRETAFLHKQHAIPEDLLRLSPAPADMAAYKCPVSTPMNVKRTQRQGKIPESLAFVSLDVSHLQNKPKQTINSYGNKQQIKHKGSTFRSPRRRNFDYYYVDKKFQKRISSHTNTYWLKALVSQPVDEIFTKYSHAGVSPSREASGRTRNFSTPGELAIMDGWESNSTKRIGSATSRISRRSGTSCASQLTDSRTISPDLTIVSKSMQIFGTGDNASSRVDSRVDSVQHPNSLGNTEDNSRAPSRGSNTQRETLEISPIEVSINMNVNEDYYDQFKRKDSKLPGIKNGRNNVITGTQRKYFTNTASFKLARRSSPAPVVSDGGISHRKIRIASPKNNSNCALCVLGETDTKHQKCVN